VRRADQNLGRSGIARQLKDSVMAGTISSTGIGSGLPISDIIASLMKVEQIPLTKLQTVATTMQTKLSAFGQMQS